MPDLTPEQEARRKRFLDRKSRTGLSYEKLGARIEVSGRMLKYYGAGRWPIPDHIARAVRDLALEVEGGPSRIGPV